MSSDEASLEAGFSITVRLMKNSKIFTGIVSMAFLTSSSIFASIHVLIGPRTPHIFLWSLIPSYLYVKISSLYPSIMMYLINNIFAYLVLPLYSTLNTVVAQNSRLISLYAYKRVPTG